MTLWKMVNGTATQLGSTVQVGAWTTGNLGIEADGNQISALWNEGVAIGPITNGDITQAGNPGIGAGWRGSRNDRYTLYEQC